MNPVSQQQIPYKTGSGAVQINIYSPTATNSAPQNTGYTSPAGYSYPNYQYPASPYSYPYYPYYPQYNTQQQSSYSNINNVNAQNPINQTPTLPTQQIQQQSVQQPTPADQSSPSEKTENKDKAEKNKKNKPIMPLTDDYIRTLENYLNNPNTDLRLMAAKEILQRFKEDESRKTDIALTNLLNKALQDPAQSVRLIALAALDSGYAIGDDFTNQILQEMQKSDAAYNQDAVTASHILLRKSGQNFDVQSTSDTSVPESPQTGQKLNVVAS